ncbi:MAG: chromate transporter [Clostridia bacterium]|nr:chromate transporter [Clostridia bacterium]
MIYLELFLSFFKIGALSFGGGLGMISLIHDTCVSSGWLTENELLNIIAVAESTPGPIAVNIATFVGSSQAGMLGALLSTLGVVLPSFIIILIIASIAKNLLKYAGVKATLTAMHPAIVGLIISVTITMLLSQLFSIKTIHSSFSFDYRALIILAVIAIIATAYTKIRKKGFSLILLIIISGALGVILY